MKYLFLLHRGIDEDLPAPGTDEAQAMFESWKSATDVMIQAGVLIDCAPLESVPAAAAVRIRRGETLVTDAPAAELKEQVGGYALVECADMDEAIRWAATLPAARDASVEVRPVVGQGTQGRPAPHRAQVPS